MASTEPPSWADQWGAGGIGAMAEDDTTKTNKDADNKKAPGGFSKAKGVAIAGAHKFKSGTSIGIKWVKNKCQKKRSPSNE